MSTPHIRALPGDFATDVLMPGDPVRAQRIAETVLDQPRLVTDVRGVLGFTGTRAGRPLSVMASGMGMPSLTIYATELVRMFGVRRIVRVGTCAGLSRSVRLRDVVVATSAHTDSAMTSHRLPGIGFSHTSDVDLAHKASSCGSARSGAGPRVHVGAVFTTDHFYLHRPELMSELARMGTLAVEMEAAGLYAVAAAEGCEALTVATVTDHLSAPEQLTSDERERGFAAALECALLALARDEDL